MSNFTTHVEGPTMDSLSFLERQWVEFFSDSKYPDLRLALLLFAWHEFVFIGCYIPYFLADYIPLRKYKIQQDKQITTSQWWKCVFWVFFYQIVLELPMMFTFHPVAMHLGMKFLEVPFPSWTESAVACLYFLFMEDVYQYFVHRLLHWGPFYKHIHKIHHEFSAPFGIASQYAHPVEIVVLGLGFFVGPLTWLAFSSLHIITLFGWLMVRLLQVVESHSGYDFPLSLRNLLPFWAGADFHDYHHMAFVGNYASSFRWWDRLMGTDTAYRAWRDRKASRLADAKSD